MRKDRHSVPTSCGRRCPSIICSNNHKHEANNGPSVCSCGGLRGGSGSVVNKNQNCIDIHERKKERTRVQPTEDNKN